MHGSATGPLAMLVAIVWRVLLFFVVVFLVWVTYVWLYAYQPDFLGYCYAKLRPITIWFYSLIDTRLPDAVKYKVSAGLSDELGPRALFLLTLGAVVEVIVLAIFQAIRALFRTMMGGGAPSSRPA